MSGVTNRVRTQTPLYPNLDTGPKNYEIMTENFFLNNRSFSRLYGRYRRHSDQLNVCILTSIPAPERFRHSFTKEYTGDLKKICNLLSIKCLNRFAEAEDQLVSVGAYDAESYFIEFPLSQMLSLVKGYVVCETFVVKLRAE